MIDDPGDRRVDPVADPVALGGEVDEGQGMGHARGLSVGEMVGSPFSGFRRRRRTHGGAEAIKHPFDR